MSYGRKIFLVNPKFQIQFSVYVCIILLILTIIYPFTIYSLMSSIVEYFRNKNPELASYYLEKRNALLIFMTLLHLGITMIAFFSCIFLSHKIAGPMYKIQKHLSAIRSGQRYDKIFFRKGDYFHEVAHDINETIEFIDENYKKDIVYLSEVSTYINNLSLIVPEDKKVVLAEISRRLGDIQERFNIEKDA